MSAGNSSSERVLATVLFGGGEVATTGDGFVAVFDAPAPAIGCALAIRDALSTLGIEVRARAGSGQLRLDPDYDSLRQDPRWDPLLRRVKELEREAAVR